MLTSEIISKDIENYLVSGGNIEKVPYGFRTESFERIKEGMKRGRKYQTDISREAQNQREIREGNEGSSNSWAFFGKS